MAILSGYYNSMGGDRKYNAEEMSKYFSGLISRGVLQNYGGKYMPTAKTGMTINIAPGKAYFSDGKYIENTTDLNITLEPSDVVLNRIDRIVLRSDKSQGVRGANIIVRKGTPSSNPAAPALVSTEEIEELSIATIRINKLVETITQANITNTIPDTAVCGYVSGLIEQVDTHELYIQYETAYREFLEESEAEQDEFLNSSQKEFNDWFSNIKELLSTSTLIREYSDVVVTTKQDQTQIPINLANYNEILDILEIYINGLRLQKDVEYTNHGTYVELLKPLDIGQAVEVVIYKSVDGSDAETVVEQVEKLTEEMAAIKRYYYFATGTDDNIKLSEIAQSFYNGEKEFTGINDAAQLKIEVVGTLGVNKPYKGTGTAEDPFIYFDFNRPATFKKLTVDFAKCSRIYLETDLISRLIDAERARIENLQATLTAKSTGGQLTLLKGMELEAENITADITAQGLGVGISGTGLINNAYMVVKSIAASTQGITIGNGLIRITNCKILAYKKAESASATGIYTAGTSTNCVILASGNYMPAQTLTGYTQTNSIHAMVGKYSIVGNALFKAMLKGSGAAGEDVGNIII